MCNSQSCAEMDGATRLVGGAENPMQRYEYGRLEVFAQGFWSKVCSADRFPPNSAQVACRALGYDGGVALWFTEAYTNSLKPVRVNVWETWFLDFGFRPPFPHLGLNAAWQLKCSSELHDNFASSIDPLQMPVNADVIPCLHLPTSPKIQLQ